MSGSGGPGSRIPFLLWVQLIAYSVSESTGAAGNSVGHYVIQLHATRPT